MVIEGSYRTTAFGLDWRSNLPLDGFDTDWSDGARGMPIEVGRVDHPIERPGGRPVNRGLVYPDGFRFPWANEAVFDMIDGARICYCPGPDWAGMPASFGSTVAALTVAWRGGVPLHACAVELDGRAVVIAGVSGAGKSTLTAALLGLGARFVADDLTALGVTEDGRVTVPPGRSTIRLHADTAARLDAIDAAPVVGDPRGKWLARPRRRATTAVELGAVVVLGDEPGDRPPVARLLPHLFRPRWLNALPMRETLLRDLQAVAAGVPVRCYPAQMDFATEDQRERARAVVALVNAK